MIYMSYEALNITLKAGAATGGPAAEAPSPTQDQKIFLGSPDTPLLAPRGVFLVNNTLWVADTAQNRVFAWHNADSLPTHALPDLVLGQQEATATGRNAGEQVSAASLQYPSAIWSDGQRLIVADAWNHRVLIWHSAPRQNGQPADVVLGQPDFSRNEPNAKGVGAAPDARTLYWPYGVFSDGQGLWVADTGNRRTLYFDQIPTASFSPADAVIGKTSFEERDYDNQDAVWPYSVKVSPQGVLAITDTQFCRVLIWKDWRTALHQKADHILGQPDMDSNGINQYGLFPDAHTLNWCYDTAFFQNGIFVADTGNSRVLGYQDIPGQNAAAAQSLLGKLHFRMGGEQADHAPASEKSLYWPFSVNVDGHRLAIADTGNHRIVLATLK